MHVLFIVALSCNVLLGLSAFDCIYAFCLLGSLVLYKGSTEVQGLSYSS